MYYMSMNHELIYKQTNAKKNIYNTKYGGKYDKSKIMKPYSDSFDYLFTDPNHTTNAVEERDQLIAELREEIEELKTEIETLRAMGED